MFRFILAGALLLVILITAGNHRGNAGPSATADNATTDSILRVWLGRQVVDARKPMGKVFWLWLGRADLDTCIKENSLLRFSLPQTDPAARYHCSLLSEKWDHEPIAKLLRTSEYQRKRDAWPVYWSMLTETAVQDSNRSQLVRVELEDSSLIVSFFPERKTNCWEVFDLDGKPVSISEALIHPGRIAAVFTQEEKTKKQGCVRNYFLSIEAGYRSFMLINEKMIKSWSHGMPGVQDKINKDVAFLLLLHAWFESDPARTRSAGKNGRYTQMAWKGSTIQDPSSIFLRTLRYSHINADQNSVHLIIELLRRRWTQQTNPAERFPSRHFR
ncbi:MAG TPA: hypothetical protein VI731_03180 [Bacteroidia bacterium]|nr:hypothetical protein [Bacteroidia bacterium]